ncbi:hypothetical protein HU200_009493 [Digitaria exilis]|uniref:Uncharacterized protein n=1 Tax=Digitaria exilis TaxID=1010633 RepID=A0A835FJ84_9POAL|nr:hypothetical protein HU200_009493 [Digitaria exilis]
MTTPRPHGAGHGVRSSSPTSTLTADGGHQGSNHVLGALLYPSVPLWSFVSGAFEARDRATSLAGVPRVVIRDLPTPVHPSTPPPVTTSGVLLDDSDEVISPRSGRGSSIPSLKELFAEEEHEVSVRHRRARRKRAVDSASKVRRSHRLAAKEDPYYIDATTKATRVKAAKMELNRTSARMKTALAEAKILERPPPARIAAAKLRCLGRVCGLAHLSEVEDEVLDVTN